MPVRTTITVDRAKALQFREEGRTNKQIAFLLNRADSDGNPDGRWVSLTLLKWLRERRIVKGKSVQWAKLLELIDSGAVDHEPEARQIVAARAAGDVWDPDTGDLFGETEQADADDTPTCEQEGPKADTDDTQPCEQVDTRQDTQAGTFTAAEVGALKRVAMRELAAPDPQRSTQSEVVRMRLDSGLLAALREHAEANGIALAAALGRAVALYLRPDTEDGDRYA